MVLGLIGYVVYRRRSGLDLTSPHRIAHSEPPPDFHELAYHSAIVQIFGTDVSAKSLRNAAKLIGEDATVEALYVLQVPAQLSLHAGMEEEEKAGYAVLPGSMLERTAYREAHNRGQAVTETRDKALNARADVLMHALLQMITERVKARVLAARKVKRAGS